jgi:hypothetical protein
VGEVADQAGTAKSAHTTSRKSARNERVEIITRGESRRSWTPEEKRAVVAESLGSELTPTQVAPALHLAATGSGHAERDDHTLGAVIRGSGGVI